MGIHSIHPKFLDIKYLGIYNPKQNEVSRIAINDIPTSVIKEVEKKCNWLLKMAYVFLFFKHI